MSYHIRPSTPDDIDSILKLIIELAVYEKEPEAVKATPALLRKNLFETPYAHALLAISGSPSEPGEAIGLALYFFNFSTWTGKPGLYLEDLFVSSNSRNLGVGKALFAELAQIAIEKECARMDWSVLKWNAPSIAFYEKVLGATPMSEWQGMRVEGDAIASLLRFKKTS
ncbi:hypothetical protein M422DRAFT_70711 [Sphaerobolus stellatus SS14]|uniref:N-acetyltransferase domain-containing protein n=1 Tax=Sphaerobolus stellatus (strain SS14) TaxID=990650 RepID=A0A0C9UBZ0_SPHS4|nr:hypothetical protein M422DRAFT_70711 [Sphaerobolus stellatus SS14]